MLRIRSYEWLLVILPVVVHWAEQTPSDIVIEATPSFFIEFKAWLNVRGDC
jgi:hypothetical protein